jgi:hypothetical protein
MNKAALALSGLLAACTVGVAGPPVGGEVDAPLGMQQDAPVQGNGCIDRSATPGIPHIHSAGGTSNAGQGCMNANCHDPQALGAGAPGWQFAGTLYQPDGITPNAGASIKIIAADGLTTKSAVTDTDGNFFIAQGSLPGAFPAQAAATACPTLTNMSDKLQNNSTPAKGGNCNGCHNGGLAPATAVLTLAQ